MAMVAAIQMVSGADIQANLAQAASLIHQAVQQGAQLIVLPENFPCMELQQADRLQTAEEFGYGPIQQFIAEQAKRYAVWLVAGTIPLRSLDPSRVCAASILYNSDGEVVARYDKIHLFDVALNATEVYHESHSTIAGQQPVVVETPVGKLGLSVCYDVRFPELYRQLSAQGAQVLIVPAAFTETTGQAHWHVLLRSRAIENLSYVIASAQGGYHANGRSTYGHSMIIDYWGRVCSELAKGPGVAVANINLAALEQQRKTFPALAHRYFHDFTV